MSEFNMSKVAAPEATEYLKPGYYQLTIQEAKYVTPEDRADGTKRTPYLEVKFGNSDGIVKEKFYISPKTLPRIQYLHESFIGKSLEKNFESAEQLGAYMERLLNHSNMKTITKSMIVSGRINADNRVFGELGYSNFVLPDDMNPQFGAFDESSALYQRYTRKEDQNNASSRTDAMVINDVPSSSPAMNEDDDDLPF